MGEEKRAFNGVWICAAIFLDEKLTPAGKILLAEIDSLSTDEHGCYASNAHFAKRLRVTESRANHVVARLTREGYIVRVCNDGRLTQRVVAPQYSSNPATSRRLIEQNRRLAKNSSSELSHSEDCNSELLKIATLSCQKEQSRTAKNNGAVLLKKVPIEERRRHIQMRIAKRAMARSRQKRRRVVFLALFCRLPPTIRLGPRLTIS